MDQVTCKRCGCTHCGWATSPRTGRPYLARIQTGAERDSHGTGHKVTFVNPRWLHDCGNCDACAADKARRILREVEDEIDAAAQYRTALRDAHDEGEHLTAIAGCDFCDRGRAGLVRRGGNWIPVVQAESDEFNARWAEHKNEYARQERDQEAAAFMSGI